MDLNGALIYRSKSNASSRTSYPRPYLSCLLDYLFLPEPDAPSDSSIPIRPWSAFVWSSAQPHNVRSMVETAFGKYSETVWNTESRQSRQDRQKRGEGRLLGVWARDKMGLDESDYRNKVQTFKDLRQVIQHVKQSRPSDYKFDLENVVLLDDSPLKAIHQPWNQIVIPEYDKPEFTAARSAATRMQYGKNAEEAGMDSTLLAVIGMLEEMRNIPNIPAWIRSGGLIKTTSTESDNDEEYVDSLLTEDRAPTIKDLPSHDTFNHWFKEQKVVSYWTQRGREALERKGIAVEHGIDLEGRSASPMSRTPPAAHFQSAADLRQRRWSPSRPVSPSFDQPDEVEGSAGRSRLAPSARSPSPTSSFSRRSFATMAQALPDTTTHQLVPAASNSWNAAPGPSVAGIPNAAASRGPQSRASKAPVPRTERWRTFSALEVSRYLSDIADRSFGASYSLQQATNQSQILRTAAQTLARYHEDVEIRRPAPSGHWEGELCVKCLKWVGGLQIGVRGQEAHQRAMAAGFNNALFMAQQHELATASGSEMATKPLTKKQRKRAKQAAAVAALASSTSSKKKKTAAAGAAATKKVTAVTEASRKKAKTDQVKGKGKKNLSNNGENAISSEVPNADSQVTLSFGNNGQTGGGEAGSSGIRDPAWKKKKKIREDRLTALAKNTATKHESDPSTPERIAKAVDRLDSSAESPPVTRSNPRRSATNVEAIRAEARLDAELYGRKSSRSRSRF
ncbi:hypothetical protein BD324DRAFT_676275 [Kockovaella imperatae]|uniref:Uncharacterized protein n=1 Tax=Kockovaella imperatae TaxID=4999 RepID=A0A1Y1UE92_9TREE|nr:hypothetical protein BD324DRAFT_676275 [Kockovaella imperatae]ORX36371.1 hypothetical protein BD324DRAFT_676275 [Kockovaella imperatae]